MWNRRSEKRLLLSQTSTLHESHETTLKDIKTDIDYIEFLKSQCEFTCIDHQDYSTEVQFPFIKHYLTNTKISYHSSIIYLLPFNFKQLYILTHNI